MDPSRFHEVARDILVPNAARCRTAIGRAYYAAFNAAAQPLR